MTFNPHVLWCSHRNIDEGLHDENMPCCYSAVGAAIDVMPDLGAEKAQLWVYATRVANPEALKSGVIPGRSAFDGITLMIEQRTGTEWDEQEYRITSGAARSLAAALTRAADIEQGVAS